MQFFLYKKPGLSAVFPSVADLGDVYSGSEYFQPGSRVGKTLDPDPHKRILNIFYPKIFTKRSGIMILDVPPGSRIDFFPIPDSGSGSRIQRPKQDWIPDPQHWVVPFKYKYLRYETTGTLTDKLPMMQLASFS
jgi:hypothetical protein